MNPDVRAIPSLDAPPGADTATTATRVALVATIAVVYARLFIGVDVTDESFYNSLPYSFAQGFRPYRDELNITQNAGILLTPLYWLYTKVAGSSDGIVLFNRHLYFLLLCGCSLVSLRVGAAYLGINFGRLLAAFTLTFSYCNIPSVSYNTLGALFLFAGLFQLLLINAPRTCPGVRRLIVGANGCFILSAFSYPTLLVSSLAGCCASLWLSLRSQPTRSPTERKANCMAWAASLALGGAAAVAFVAYFGFTAIGDSLAYASSYGYKLGENAPRTVRTMAIQLGRLAPYVVAFGAVLALPVLPARSFGKWRAAYVGAVVSVSLLALFLIHRQPSLRAYPAGSAPLLLSLGLLFPLTLLLLPDRRKAWELALIVGAPSYLAAAAISFSSTSALQSSTLGFFPAVVGSFLCVGMIAQQIDRSAESNRVRSAAALGMLIPILIFQNLWLLNRSYRDAPFSSSSAPVFASGAFAGLLTTEPRAQLLAALTADLNSLGSSARTLFVYDRFPAAYLLSNLKPRTFSTWIFWPEDISVTHGLLHRVFASGEAPPDAILQMGAPPAQLEAEMRRLNYQVHLDRRELGYALLLRDSAPKPSP